jgi:F-type H+-transporting ATPase subunit b
MGFDWSTFGLELVNFLVLVLVLHRVLYRPLRRAIDERRESAAGAEAELVARREALDTETAELADARASIATLRAKVRAEATEDAASERARILEQAREDAASERARVQALLDTERQAAEAWVKNIAIERGTELAGRMLEKLAPDAIDVALRRALFEALRARAGELRGGAESGDEADVEVTGARFPDDHAVAELREHLTVVLGRRPRLTVKEDESLREGLVLRVGDFVLDASLAGQLAGLRTLARELADDLAHDPHARTAWRDGSPDASSARGPT